MSRRTGGAMYDALYWAKEKNKEATTLLENLILTTDFSVMASHGFVAKLTIIFLLFCLIYSKLG